VDDVQAPVVAVLDRLTRLVTDARAMPMSASCVVNRGEVLALLEEARRALPEALTSASALLGERAGVLADGRAEAEKIVEQARAERAAMLTKTAVQKTAQQEARRVLEEAEAQAEALRAEVEEYVDGKLANFEVVLSKTLGAVQRGRARLHGESEHDALAASLAGDGDPMALPAGDAIPRGSRD
jgi:cell division septum initiation protein DivIVA